MRASLVLAACLAAPSLASAQTRTDAPPPPSRFADPTGGAFTSPTTLFTSAAAVPTLDVRGIAGTAPYLRDGSYPRISDLHGVAQVLGRGFTLGAGTTWFGGDSSNAFNNINPYAQVRYQILGDASGTGPLLGASLTYKRIGYLGGENELEASVSFQYRRARFEAGVQGTFGQSLNNGSERDIEARVYAVGRPTPRLALGVAAQVRGDVGEECTTSDEAACEAEERARLMTMQRAEFDLLGGAIASFTYERWQLGGLFGASTLGYYENVGLIAQAFGSVRF
jgi:hypothetical protein